MIFFVLFVEVSFYSSSGCMGGLNVTDVRRRRIPLLWSKVREITLAKCFSCNTGDTKYPCVCRRTNLPGRSVYFEKARETDRGCAREEVTKDS